MAVVTPHIVLLPGLDGTGFLFDGIVAALRTKFHVQVVTYPVDKIMNYLELFDFIVPQLPQDRPYIILGESFAGSLALRLAAVNPHICGVVLCVTFARYPLWYLSGISGVIELLPIYQIRNSPPFHWLMRRELGKELLHAVDRAVAAVKPEVMLARMRFVLAVDATPSLKQVRVPMLYLRATKDAVVTSGAVRHILHHRPDVQVRDFPTHHFLLQSMPDEAAAAIAGFATTLSLAHS